MEIYVTVEQAGTDDEYLQVNKTGEECAVLDEKRKVGRYVLHETVFVEAKVTVSGNPHGTKFNP